MAVILEPNSLYIATQMLDEDSTENFHWSFFITDAAGDIEQHEWNMVLGKSWEKYQHYTISDLQATSGPAIYLSFTKLSGNWNPPSSDILQDSLSMVFEERTDIHYCRNRDKGLSCRTWVTKAVRMFVQKGWLFIPTREAWRAIEPNVIIRSRLAALIYLDMKNSQNASNFTPSYGLIDCALDN
ncbi:hypothetical protein BDN70DRAFT_937895 [Pholiota conissans]|uniref:Uncharacterized protein n=1 Tax=Pholiota conissans TaxID=109636 RepID=A0A9P5YN49_9AGAR|nr:hypothetical protein BDN70DRAFT_937895 [Pholiota conissans]